MTQRVGGLLDLLASSPSGADLCPGAGAAITAHVLRAFGAAEGQALSGPSAEPRKPAATAGPGRWE